MHQNFPHMIFHIYNYWAFLKTGINLRNLPPAHSRGAVTFSGLRLSGVSFGKFFKKTKRVEAYSGPKSNYVAQSFFY